MALSAQLTKISVHPSKLPTGYTDPGGSNLASSQPTYENVKLNVLKSTVENATKATTFDNIRTDVGVGIEQQIAALLGNDFDDTANTITYNIDWKDIETNLKFAGDFYTNSVVNYIATVDVYVVVS